jgi:hypothetical protein
VFVTSCSSGPTQSPGDLLFGTEQRTQQSTYITYTHTRHTILNIKHMNFFCLINQLFLLRLHLLIFFLFVLCIPTNHYEIYVEIKGGAHLCTWLFTGNVTRGGVVSVMMYVYHDRLFKWLSVCGI